MEFFRRLVREVHRRSIWQVLGVYVVSCWVVLEVVQGMVEMFELPAWLPPFALVLLLVGLPIVLATAFVQKGAPGLGGGGSAGELSELDAIVPDGDRVQEGLHHRLFTWRNAIGGGVVAFALWGFVAAGWLFLGGGSGADEAGRAPGAGLPSVAVLPFANTSGDAENEAFVNGIHDDVITHLHKVGDLRVTSRTSVLEYREGVRNIRRIADELGVGTVLEGGVQRAGNRVRINVQLIDATTDDHLWAEIFDRELTADNIFAIQSEIARRIASELHATLSPEEAESLDRRPTEDLEAYTLYLQGNELITQGSEDENNLFAAEALYRQALERDPLFAEAHARLGIAHARIWWWTDDRTAERLALARASAERALDLEPGLPEGYVALAYVHYWGYRDYDRALAELEAALRARPGDALILNAMGNVLRRAGRFEEALARYLQAEETDPRSPRLLSNLETTYAVLRRWDEREEALSLRMQIDPGAVVEGRRHDLLLWGRGDVAGARERLEAATERLGEDPLWDAWWDQRMVEGDYRGALDLADARGGAEGLTESQEGLRPWGEVMGAALRLAGEEERAQDALAVALQAVERRGAELEPDDWRAPAARARILASLGRRAEALAALARAEVLMPLSRDAIDGTRVLEARAAVHTALGENDEAVATLERLLSIPSYLTRARLRLDPLYTPLRDHPQFRALAGLDG